MITLGCVSRTHREDFAGPSDGIIMIAKPREDYNVSLSFVKNVEAGSLWRVWNLAKRRLTTETR